MSSSALAVVAVVATVVALVALAALVIGWRARRRAVLRLAAVTSRLGGGTTSLTDQATLEHSLAALERAASEGALRVTDVASMSQRLVEALAMLDEGVVICDQDGQVAFQNACAGRVLGDPLGGVLVGDVVSRVTRRALTGEHADESIDLFGPPRRSFHVRAAPLQGAGSLGAVVIIDDLSERRRLDAVRRDFVANISHELKTPIGALGLLAETLAGEEDHDVARRLAGRMHGEAMRVARIIEELLDLSRIESEAAPEREPVAVHVVVAEATERLRRAAEHASVNLEPVEPARDLVIAGDRRQLVAAVQSLVENAINYTGAGGTVLVAAHREDDSICIEVADTGIGIPTRDLDRIFERFYRVDRGRGRATGGTGLGLAIVRHVVQNHGGTVDVESEEGRGSTFRLLLPAVNASSASSAPAPEPQREASW